MAEEENVPFPSLFTLMVLGKALREQAKVHGLTPEEYMYAMILLKTRQEEHDISVIERLNKGWGPQGSKKAPQSLPYKCRGCVMSFATSDKRNAHAKSHGA